MTKKFYVQKNIIFSKVWVLLGAWLYGIEKISSDSVFVFSHDFLDIFEWFTGDLESS